jgi:hypothetical protein
MKKIGIIGLFILLFTFCNGSEDEIQDTWDVTVSRATTNGENIMVIGKKNGNDQLHGILIPSKNENTMAQ